MRPDLSRDKYATILTPKNHPSSFIAKRHKTVRNFLTNFEKKFLVLAQKHPPLRSSFIYRDETDKCYQSESMAIR